jgi:two-component system, NarL family, response regulator DevR
MALPAPLPATPIRVVVVDADDRVRESLAGILAGTERVQVLGTAGEAATALALIRVARPDAIVLDPRLPDVDGAMAFIAAVRADLPSVCILAMSWSDPMEHAALAAGADGYVRKTYRSSELIAALMSAIDGCS